MCEDDSLRFSGHLAAYSDGCCHCRKYILRHVPGIGVPSGAFSAVQCSAASGIYYAAGPEGGIPAGGSCGGVRGGVFDSLKQPEMVYFDLFRLVDRCAGGGYPVADTGNKPDYRRLEEGEILCWN